MTDPRVLGRIGDALRAERARQRRLRRRAIASAALCGALIATTTLPVRPRLLWNASRSMPAGLYSVTTPDAIGIDDIVVVRLPPAWRTFADARHYVPATIPLVKRVAGAPGDRVCAQGADIFIDGRWRADRRRTDSHGRWMPWWQGCVTLRAGAVFLLTENPLSFDGRYVGPTPRVDIVGHAHPLWTR